MYSKRSGWIAGWLLGVAVANSHPPAIAAPASCEPYLTKAAEVLQQAELAVATRRQEETQAAAKAQRFTALWQEGALSRRQAEQAQAQNATATQNLERAIAAAQQARSQWQELQSLTDCAQYQPAKVIESRVQTKKIAGLGYAQKPALSRNYPRHNLMLRFRWSANIRNLAD
ncbi:MAG: hypothetical protein HC918_14605 [Oscillatoriales cyanobacterium SM2_1_8]|nr:hypothetical protein [Oscillatoriales cyanobacterium SM2_1_8]